MAIYNWSALTNGQVITTFNPSVDVLTFNDASISAADVIVNGDTDASPATTTLSYGGKSITIEMDPRSTTISNVTFANGSKLMVGDNSTTIPVGLGTSDDAPQTITGGSGNDQIIGLGGADSLVGGAGNDFFKMFSGTAAFSMGNDTVVGGAGTDTISFRVGDDAINSGITVNYTGFSAVNGALATITGADGSNTVTMSGVERVTGTEFADTFNGTTAIHVNGLRTDVTLVFEGADGADVINGAAGEGQTTFISYRSSASGITVNLSSGITSNDGLGGTDTFTNIDGVFGSDFADSITGGSNSISTSGTQLEFFEGFRGNDTIDGGNGGDRVQYDSSPQAVIVNLGNGTAQDGWTGTFTKITTVDTSGEWGLSHSPVSNLQVSGDTLTLPIQNEGFFGLSRVADVTNSLVGSWYITNAGDANSTAVITFLSDGTYFFAEDGDSIADPNGQDGMERGTYTWNSSTGAFTNITTVDTNGEWGFSHGALVTNMQVVGNTLTATDSEGSFEFSRVTSVTNPLVGGWHIADGTFAAVITFLGDGTYFMAEDGDSVPDPSGQDGMERGTYTWNPLAGTDTLININQARGSAFNDTMLGGADDDQFEGANGNDFIDGGAGFDAVRYTRATNAVLVNLATGEGRALAADASVGVDFFTHIEDVRGGDFADSLVGGGDGLLESGAVFSGAEAFEGRAGNDTISGGDTVVGSGSIDLARYINAPLAVIVNLSAAAVLGVASNRANDGYGVNGNPAGIDTLININGAAGSNFNDTLVGGNNDEFFEGRKGADSIVGGLGADMLMYGDSPAAVTINLGTNVYNDGWGTVDIVSGIENVIGSVFDDSLTGDANANRLEGDSGADTLAGGLGNDTLFGGDDGENDVADYSAASGAVTVNLGAGTASGAAGSDTLIGIEFVFGGAFADTVTGDEEANFIRGNGGNDTLDGGGQSLALAVGNFQGDFADYQSAAGAVTVSLALQGAGQVTGQGTDRLTNFESIRGSVNGDTLTGDAGNNFLRGGLGNDTLNGGGGIDWADYRNASASVTVSLATNTSSGADGVDALSLIEGISGSDFNDTFTGSAGDDWFRGRNGNDSITGGTGFDMVTYRPAGGGVTVNLGAGTVTGAEGSDTLSGIEGAEGTMFNDTLIGNNATANALYGFSGNDTLRVTQGADTLDGGADFDTIDFSAVTGVVYAGTTAVSVNLATHVADLNRSAAGANSVLVSIETVFGTAGNDIFVGGDAAHALDSLGNNIAERFRGNAGNDTITGATGAGIFTYADYANNTNTQHVTASLFTGIVSDGLSGTDTLVNVDGLRGGAGNDLLVGGSLSRSGGWTFFEVLRGNGGNDTLDGGNANSGGTASSADRADYSGNTNLQAVSVNLGTGVALDGMGGTDTLIDIEHVYGGAGNDTLTGSSTQNDDLDGGAGNDTIDGSGGSDTVRFQQSTAGVIVNLSASAIKVNGVTVATGMADDGMGGTDTLISIESVRGTDFNDYIRGSDNVSTRQFFAGDAGNDTFDGGAGIDFANYSDVALVLGGINATIASGAGTVNDKKGGTDTLINIEGLAGTHSDDTLAGGSGDQWFRGNGSNDTINGGSGNDWVLYSNDPLGVTVNLATGTATDGWNGPDGLLGLGGTDTLASIENAEGSDFNDVITGSNGVLNELRGRAGNDSLAGGSSNDTLLGGDGNDTLRGDAGDDVLNGDAGTDTASYVGATAGVTVNLLASIAQNTVGAGSDTLTTIENLLGSSLADTLTGNDSANVIDGANGNDTLDGGLGNDTLIGGLGDDAINGNNGVDTVSYAGAAAGVDVRLYQSLQNNASAGVDTLTNIENVIGSNFDDTLLGDGSTNNHLAGGAGNDFLDGSGGTDTLVGGVGDDSYSVHGLSEIVSENVDEGIDTVSVHADITYTLGANIENGQVASFATTNFTGNSLNNTIFEGGLASAGNNVFNGSTGIDTMNYRSANGAITISLVLQGVAQNTVSEGSDTLSGFENLTGSDFGDTLTGNSAANQLEGALGNDTLVGGSSNDTLLGGDGNDSLRGDAGDDNLNGGAAGSDTASYAGAASAVSVSLVIAAQQNTGGAGLDTLTSIEHLLGSSFNDTFTGSSAANQLDGATGNDTLIGGTGNDTLIGGTGDDNLRGDAGDDNLNGGAAGSDTASYVGATSGVSVSLAIVAQQNTVGAGLDTLTSIEHLLGSSFNDTFTGSSAANQLDGALGNDTLTGGTGNDTLLGSDGNDILKGDAGDDNLSGGTGIDTASYVGAVSAVTVTLSTAVGQQNTGGAGLDTLTSIEHLLGSSFNDSFTGNSAANKLEGGSGNDTLSGGSANDTLVGGNGTDRLTGGTGIDLFDYNALVEAGDTITDFTAGAGGDKIDIDTLLTAIGYVQIVDPITDGYIIVEASGADTLIRIDSDGAGGNAPVTLATLLNVTAANVTLADNFIV